jgi:hypothetical protein
VTRAEPESLARLGFEATVIHWRGPSPFFFVPIPAAEAEELRRISRAVTYGWGMIPVQAAIGDVVFTTSLFPKDGSYLLPIKAEVRRRAEVTAGDRVFIELTVQAPA